MKEVKTTYLKVRVTASEKERIQQYCEEKGLTFSEFMRMLWTRAIALEKEEKNEQR